MVMSYRCDVVQVKDEDEAADVGDDDDDETRTETVKEAGDGDMQRLNGLLSECMILVRTVLTQSTTTQWLDCLCLFHCKCN